MCDGRQDCDDGYDESQCVDREEVQQEQVYRYRMSRYSRYDDYYDNWDGDWGWFDANIDEDKEQFVKIPLPPTCDEWYLTAFSVSKEFGIAVYDELIPYDTCRPLWLFCEAPEVVHRGETVSIKCTIFNWQEVDEEIVIVLHGSDDYSFVNVEENGYVVSFAPRLTSGDHHHFMFIRAVTTFDVHLPIAPKVQHGTMEVKVSLRR